MIKIKVDIAPYKGEYEWDQEREYSTNEWRWIKQISGYMPLTIREGWDGGDPALFLALAVVMMVRAGKIRRDEVGPVAEELADAPFDGAAMTVVGDPEDEEGEDVPLVLTSEPDGSSPRGSLETPRSTGPGSRTGSAPSDVTRPATSLSRSGTS